MSSTEHRPSTNRNMGVSQTAHEGNLPNGGLGASRASGLVPRPRREGEDGFHEEPGRSVNPGQGALEVEDDIEGRSSNPETSDTAVNNREYSPTIGITGPNTNRSASTWNPPARFHHSDQQPEAGDEDIILREDGDLPSADEHHVNRRTSNFSASSSASSGAGRAPNPGSRRPSLQ